MKFREIVNRVSGFSCPIFGVQWNPVEVEITKARRIVAFLEDRRVLYVPSEMEVPRHCVESVLEIRRFLTNEIGAIDSNSELANNLRGMRAACRKFLTTVQQDGSRIVVHGGQLGHHASWIFNGALGELRGVFGIHIARIAASYGLDVEDELSTILPALDNDNDNDSNELDLFQGFR